MRSFFATFSLLTLLAAPAAIAGDGPMYVPLFGSLSSDGYAIAPKVNLTNDGGTAVGYETFIIPLNTDGTSPGAPSSTGSVAAGETLFDVELAPAEADYFRGMLRIDSDGPLTGSADLFAASAATPDLDRDSLPVLSSADDGIPADTWVLVDGWLDLEMLYLINFSGSQSRCMVQALDATGAKVFEGGRPVEAQGISAFWRARDYTSHRFRVTCDARFYALGYSWNGEAGNLTVHPPELEVGTSTGGGDPPPPPPPPPDDDPPPTGLQNLLTIKGMFHKPTKSNDEFMKSFKVPQGDYSRVILEVTIKHGGWVSLPGDNDFHQLFHIYQDRHGSGLFGYCGAQPGKIVLRHGGWTVPHTSKPKAVKAFRMEPGKTYRLRYDYNVGAKQFVLTLSQGGSQVFRVDGATDRSNIPTNGKAWWVKFSRDLSHPEPPTLGWEYSDLQVQGKLK